jgi:putative ABC transport system permease protein
MIQDLFLLSVNSMKRRKLRSWLTLLGIFIGILAVVSLISLGDGLRQAITGQFSGLSVDTLTVTNAETGFGPPGSTAVKKLNDHDLKLIESVKGSKIVVPRLIRVVRVEYNKIAKFNYATNLPDDSEKIDFVYTGLNLKLEDGKLLNPGDSGKVILGNDFVTNDMFDKKIRVGNTINIQGKDFQVVGIFEKGSSIITNGVIYMTEKDMKDLLNIENEYDLIVVRADSPDNVEKLAKDLENKLRRDRGEKIGEEDFSVQTPVQSLQTINTILDIINVVVIGIAAISLIIGGIGITNTMYTSVLERTKEIGTMKAIGAKNSNVMSLFVIESGLFGLVGGILGALFGIFISYLVSTGANSYFGQDIFKFQVSWMLIVGAICFSFFIGVIAGIVPSYQASKLKPADALRS